MRLEAREIVERGEPARGDDRGRKRLGERRRRLEIDAAERAVEVDDVQPFEAGRREGAGLRRGIVVEDGDGGHVAAQQADALPRFEVDRRKQDHGGYGAAPPAGSTGTIRLK